MAICLLESKKNPHPPGTVLLADNASGIENTEAVISQRLKHGTGKNAHIVLVPQPSYDPNDPLNWSIWYRDSIVLAFVYCTFAFAGATGPLLSPIAFDLVVKYNKSFTAVSLLTGYQLLTVAFCGFLVSPATKIFGKRPVLIVCSIIGLAGSIWLVYADTYSSTLGARILQGIGVSFYEGVGFGLIADLYFVHERGARIGAFLFPLGAFNVMCPLLSGVVAKNLGISWMFKLNAIFAGIATTITILFIPETAYKRDSLYNIDVSSIEHLGELAAKEAEAGGEKEPEQIETLSGQQIQPVSTVIPDKKSYLQMLKPWSDLRREEITIRTFFGPLKHVINPAVLWSFLTQGAISAWTVAVSFLLAQIFAVPPYNYNSAQIGYLYGGAMVGGLLAEIFCIVFNDRAAKMLARRNGGVYEPEFRLWIIVPMLITGIIGFFGFGSSIVAGKGPIVASMFYGFITASLIFSHVASGSYMTDAFRNDSVEIFIDVMVFKNILFYVFSLFINDWVTKDGPTRVFNILGALQIFIAFLSIPLYVFGKKNRAWIHSQI